MDLAFTHGGAPGLSLWRNVEGKAFERVDLPSFSSIQGRRRDGHRLRQRRLDRPGRDRLRGAKRHGFKCLRNVEGRFEDASAAVGVGTGVIAGPGCADSSRAI